MSHFTQVKTAITNVTQLKKALKAMGHTVVEGENGAAVEVHGFFEESQTADFKILTSTKYDIGFKQSVDGSYEVVGDWELLPKVSGIDQEEFHTSLRREYAKQVVLGIAQERGYEVQCHETENGAEMVVSQW